LPVAQDVEAASNSAVQTLDAGAVESASKALDDTVGECLPVTVGGFLVLLFFLVVLRLPELLGPPGLLAHSVGALLDDSVASVASNGDLLVAIAKVLHVDSSL